MNHDVMDGRNDVSWRVWLRGMRLRTLSVSFSSVCLGVCAAWLICRPVVSAGADSGGGAGGLTVQAPLCSPLWWIAVSLGCAVVACGLQIAANLFNDADDGARGLDDHRVASPGGEGMEAPARLVASGVPVRAVRRAGVMAAAVASLTGVVVTLASVRWGLLLLGLACVLAAWGYTGGKHPYGYHACGEVAVLLVFGPVAVCGTAYALVGWPVLEYGGWRTAAMLALASLSAGFPAVLLMLVNNIRDVGSDEAHGKHTLATRYGVSWAMGLMMVTQVALMMILVTLVLTATALDIFGVSEATAVRMALPGWWSVVVRLSVMMVPLAAVLTGLQRLRAAMLENRYAGALACAGVLPLLVVVTWTLVTV